LYVDMLPIIQRDYKLDNYKLKTVSDLFIGETKDPLTAKDIFKCYKIGTTIGKTPNEEQRAKNAISIVGKYCVQDSALVFRLFNNLQTWVGLVEMATTCNVPIFTLYTQGQQIKVFSQIYKECLDKNYVVEKDGYIAKDDEKLTGALVLDPIPGIYDKITPFDFTSLYPTTIIAYNLCFSTLVKDNDPIDDKYCHVININEHKNCIAEGSMVSLYNSSVPIESLYNHKTVLTFNSNSTLEYQPMNHWYYQGKQQCVRLDFDNGRHLICTPDHKIKSRDRGWINADELNIKDKIECGIMYPQVICDSCTFNFYIDDDLSFRTQTIKETAKFLAYTRILGYLNLDSSHYQYIARTPNLVDAQGLIQDVLLVTGEEVGHQYNGLYYSVHIPLRFHKNVLHNYMTNGIPVYLLHKDCPKAFITEFIGSLFGQSYLLPEFHKKIVTGVSITSTNNLQWIQHVLKKLYNIDSYITGNNCLSVSTYSVSSFYNEISYRYNTLKQYRLELIVNYMKRKQVFWKRYMFKNYLNDAGVYDLFTKSNLDTFPSYTTTLTKLAFNVHHKVYDITVPTTSSFVCNGIIVHNCDHDTDAVKKDLKNITCQDYRYRFLKEPKGIVPTLLEDLLNARKQTRNQQKEIKQQMESTSTDKKAELQLLYNVLEKRQLAYKVSANSVYGAYGTRRGYLPFLPGAQCTTALGRMNILKAGKYIQEHYKAKLVYGDTDSVYVNFPVQSEGSFETLWDFCEQVESEINSLFLKPMYLSFESAIYDRFFILTKKRYVCLKADRNGKISDKLMIRGVLLTRRDNAPMIRDIYKQTVMSIFYKEDPVKIVDTILAHINKMFTRQHDLSVYVITKSIGEIADYKIKPLSEDEKKRMKRLKDLKCTEQEYMSRALPANAQLAEKMRRRGKLVSASQRIEYVITNPKNHLAKQCDKIEDVEYAREHSDVIQIDPLYYLKLMSKSMDEVLFVGLRLNEMVTRQYKYRLLKHKILEELGEYFGNGYRVISV
jgi:DNA polymerase elongation subunit (family B)